MSATRPTPPKLNIETAKAMSIASAIRLLHNRFLDTTVESWDFIESDGAEFALAKSFAISLFTRTNTHSGLAMHRDSERTIEGLAYLIEHDATIANAFLQQAHWLPNAVEKLGVEKMLPAFRCLIADGQYVNALVALTALQDLKLTPSGHMNYTAKVLYPAFTADAQLRTLTAMHELIQSNTGDSASAISRHEWMKELCRAAQNPTGFEATKTQIIDRLNAQKTGVFKTTSTRAQAMIHALTFLEQTHIQAIADLLEPDWRTAPTAASGGGAGSAQPPSATTVTTLLLSRDGAPAFDTSLLVPATEETKAI